MSIYERILNVDKETFERLMSSGFMRSNAKRDLEIYEYYEEERPKVGSMQAITNAATTFCISEDHTKRIIYNIRSFCGIINKRHEK